jgi:outer membrane protein assembly factor BamB
MKARRTIALLVAGLAISAGTAGAAPIKWISVPLGTHRFGHLQRPQTVVARAGADEVGFKRPGHCGCTDGPAGPVLFDVSRGGSVWLFDVLRHRFLIWKPGHAAHPRVLRLPGLDIRDFALGHDGTIYLYAVYAEPPAGDSGANLWALAPSGKTLWRVHALMGDGLRIGADGVLYSVRSGWTPLTTPAGRPLSVVQQRRRTIPFQPLAGGAHAVTTQLGPHEVHYALVRGGKVVRAWRVTSRTPILVAQRSLIPALVGDDLVVALDVGREREVLRLTATGSQTFSVAARAVYGDEGAGAVTALRVGPDGLLYQLRTNPRTGVTIARYSLAANR